MLSNSVLPNGLGNESNLLGRHYMTHLTGELGHLVFHETCREELLGLKRTRDGVYCQRTMQLPASVRRKHSMLNLVLRPTFNDSPDPGHNNATLSLYYLARRFMTPEQRHKFGLLLPGAVEPADLRRISRQHLSTVAGQLPSAVGFALWWIAAKRMRRRRVPLLFVRRRGHYPLEYISEQRPNSRSRVCLSESRDRLGLRLLAVHWEASEEDRSSISKGYHLLRDGLAAKGGIALAFDDQELRNALDRARPSGGHHMGTTRMGTSERDSVVGPDCEVWGTSGLFVASSAVFPTSGAANPTLTIVALSLRIADHLHHAMGAG
jgi:choline dehydrogenase-like flavoprotein